MPAVEFARNNAVHDNTDETPFVLNSGRHPATPLDIRIRRSQVPAAKDFVGVMHDTLKRAKACLVKAQ